jgi:hypothetical protein
MRVVSRLPDAGASIQMLPVPIPNLKFPEFARSPSLFERVVSTVTDVIAMILSIIKNQLSGTDLAVMGKQCALGGLNAGRKSTWRAKSSLNRITIPFRGLSKYAPFAIPQGPATTRL